MVGDGCEVKGCELNGFGRYRCMEEMESGQSDDEVYVHAIGKLFRRLM
jgi:hypothetical protein